MKDGKDSPDLFQEASIALEKYCKKNGQIFDFPSADMSEIGTKYVYLRNVNGLLAKYDIERKIIVV